MSAFFCLFSSALHADTVTWTGSTSNNWSIATNWSPNQIPTSTHTVVIANTATKPQLTSAVSISSLTIDSGGQLTLNQFNLTVSTDITINGALICSGGEQITLGGNWAKPASSTFTALTSTVVFRTIAGATSTLTGYTTFYGLAALTPGTTLAFAVGTTQYATNMTEFRNVSLLSNGGSGTIWFFGYAGSSQTIRGVRVRDCSATANNSRSMDATDSTNINLANNTRWVFTPTTLVWGGGAGGNWTYPNNWNGNRTPVASDAVMFNGTTNSNSTMDVPFTVAGIHVLSGYTSAINLNNNTLTITSSGTFQSGQINSGTISITGPSTTTFSGTLFGATVTCVTGGLVVSSATFNSNATLMKNVAGNFIVAGKIVKTTGTDSTLIIKSSNSIIVSSAITSTSGKLSVLLNADAGGNSNGYINISSFVMTNGGSFTAGGGAGTISAGSGYAVGNSSQVIGVGIFNSTVAALGGDIIINGHGFDTSTNLNHGVIVTGVSAGITTTGSGSITLSGQGGGASGNSNNNYGIQVATGGVISAVDGNIICTNTIGGGAGSGGSNYGLYLTAPGNFIRTTGSGGLILTSTGGNPSGSSSFNYGIFLKSKDCVRATGGGSIIINGTGANSSASNHGVVISSSIAGNGGAISVTGTGGDSISSHGIMIQGGNAGIQNTGSGTLTLQGQGGSPHLLNGNVGVDLTGGAWLQTVNGDLTIALSTGGGAVANNYGVYLDSVTIRTTGTGNISISGVGGYSSDVGNHNHGIAIFAKDSLKATGGGTITLIGIGGAGNSGTFRNAGIYISTSISLAGASLTMSGTGGANNGNDNYGVYLDTQNTSGSAAITTSGTGTLTITGQGGGTGSSINNYGVYLAHGSSITSTGSGAITVTGIRGGGDTTTNQGFKTSIGANKIGGASASGDITIIVDTMTLAANTSFQTTGALWVRPYTAATSIGVNGGAGTLNLNGTTLGYFSGGSVIIGSNTVTAQISVSSYSWTVPITYAVNDSTAIVVTGKQSASGAASITFTGPVVLSTDVSVVSGSISFSTAVTKTGVVTSTISGRTTIGGDLTISAGTLAVTSTVSVAGHWVNNGSFAANNSTVIFNGSTVQTLSGSTTFYALRALTNNATLQFTAGTTQYVTRLVEFRNVGLLSSGAAGTTWYFCYKGSSQTLSNLRVRDSNASVNGGTTMNAYSAGPASTDLGNNTNWSFSPPDNGIRYWAATSAGNWSNPNNWSTISGGGSFGGVPTATHTVVFDGGSVSTCTVDTAVSIASLTVTGFSAQLYTNGYDFSVSSNVTVSSGYVRLGTSVVTINGDLLRTGGRFDATGSTIQFAGALNATLTPGGTSFYNVIVNKTGNAVVTLGGAMISSANFSLNGGTLTTSGSNFAVNIASGVFFNGGTLRLNASQVTVGEHWRFYSGEFNAGTSTVTFLGPGSYDLMAGGQQFSSIKFNKAGATWTLQSDLNLTGNLSFAAGTLDTNINSPYNVSIASDVIFTGGSFTVYTSTILAYGNWASTFAGFGGGIYGGTVTFCGSGSKIISESSSFNNVLVNLTGGTRTFTLGTMNSMGVAVFGGVFDLGSSLLAANGKILINGGTLRTNGVINANGGWTVQSGAFSARTSTVVFDTSQTISPNGTQFYTVKFAASQPQYLFQLASSMTVQADLIVSSGTFDTNSYGVTVGRDLFLTSGTLTLDGSLVNVVRNWNRGGAAASTFNPGTSIVNLTATSTNTLTGSTTFYGLRALTTNTTVAFIPGTTQYVTGMVEFRNVCLRSTNTAGTTWYFSYTGSSQTLKNLRVRDSNASVNGGLAMNAFDGTSINTGNNTNWFFTPYDTGVRYWISGAGSNWNNASNWAYSSGGSANGGVPLSTHSVVFDSGGAGFCRMDKASITVSSFTVANYASVIYSSGAAITVNSLYAQTGGTVALGSATVNVAGNFSVTAGSFNAGTSTVTFTTTGVSTLTGPATFHILRAMTAGSTLQFTAGTTIYASFAVNFATVSLLSSTNGATWYLSLTGSSQTIQGVRVRDSNASANALIGDLYSKSYGNNQNWFFNPFSPLRTTIDVADGGMHACRTVWGDYDNDGYLDILANGQSDMGGATKLRVYRNNGNGTINETQILDTVGLRDGGAAWGDFDNDGDLDILISGYDLANRQILVYKNNGNGTFNTTAINVPGAANLGLEGLVTASWGDFDNDGDLDVLVNGTDGSNNQLRIYKNNGNGTFNATPIDVAGVDNGSYAGGSAFFDFDNDGDLDVLNYGAGTPSSTATLIYKNNGNGSFDTTPVDIGVGFNNGSDSSIGGVGDFDNDGNIDVVINGYEGSNLRFKQYMNNGNGTFQAPRYIAYDEDGLLSGQTVSGDINNDGYLDIVANGQNSGSVYSLRTYFNDGTGTFKGPAELIPHAQATRSSVDLGDMDNDGDLDLVTGGYDNTGDQLYFLVNSQSVLSAANTKPSAPSTLTSTFTFSSTGISTATFKWTPASDSGGGATNATALSYDVQVSTSSNFSPPWIIPGLSTGTSMWSGYLKPAKIFDGNTTHGVNLISTKPWTGSDGAAYGLRTDTTYYFRVYTIDAGLAVSLPSTTGTLNTNVAPSAITNLIISGNVGSEVDLNWTAPGDDQMGGTITSGKFRIYFTTSASDTAGLTATTSTTTTLSRVDISTSSVGLGTTRYYSLTGLAAGATSYIRIFTADEVPNWSGISNGATIYILPFDPNPINVDGVDGGLSDGGVAWGDFDNDGDLDILASGEDAGGGQLRVYRNNANGTFDPAQIEVPGSANNGLWSGKVAWGDFDNDGDLDAVISGWEGANSNIRVYKNNGNGTFNATSIDVPSTNNGLNAGGVAFGDYDNDGDLDLLVSGYNGAGREVRVYKNNGNGTFDANQVNVAALHAGLVSSSIAWGDYDNDGDLDVLASGSDTGGDSQLSVYTNTGNGAFNPTPVDVAVANLGVSDGEAAWGDFDLDGDLDVVAVGSNRAEVYKNNGNGTFDTNPIAIDTIGLQSASVAVGDYDNDGRPDILTSGIGSGGPNEIYICANNANGTYTANGITAQNGLANNGSVAWGDYDNDGDLDILVAGEDNDLNRQLRVYTNLTAVPNAAPTSPSAGAMTYAWNYDVNRSTLAIKWPGGGYDTGLSSHSLTYNVWLATNTLAASPPSGYEKTVITPRQGSPLNGNYLNHAERIWPGDAFVSYGVYLATTPNINSNSLKTDTAYYFRAQTIDAGLLGSSWSQLYTVRTDVAPSAVTNLGGVSGSTYTSVNLSWTAPGDDQVSGSINSGMFRIYYSSVIASLNGLTATTSTTTTLSRVDISTSGVAPSTTRYYTLTGLSQTTTYYLRIFTADEVPNWSSVSNGATFYVSQFFKADVDGVNGGLTAGRVALGDFDNDGDLDILAEGLDSNSQVQIRVYKNNGNGTFDPNQIEVDGASNNGLANASLVWGDYDNDGDLDVIVSGGDNANHSQLRIYKNNGNGTFNTTPYDVDGVNGGVMFGGLAMGDFDNDGDLDIAAAGGSDGFGPAQFRIYKNNGNGTYDPNEIDVIAADTGISGGGVAWGDFDNDGDLDLLISGTDTFTSYQVRVFKNNGNGTINSTPVEVAGAGNGLAGGGDIVAWGDYDNDGDLDVLAAGQNSSLVPQLRVYKNNGNGTFNSTQIEVPGAADIGIKGSGVAWGDFDNDGDLDIVANGTDAASSRQLRMYLNNGNGTINPNPWEIDGVNMGLSSGGIAVGDFDGDARLDIVANGADTGTNPQLRTYRNLITSTNTAPAAPSVFTSSWTYGVNRSTVTFKWASGTAYDTGFSSNSVYFNLWVATNSTASSPPAGNEPETISPRQGSPFLGNYLRAANQTWPGDGSPQYGVYFSSKTSSSSSALTTDTSYYFRVQSIDVGLMASAWSSQNVVRTDVAPSAVTNLTTLGGAGNTSLNLIWTAPGDDQTSGAINSGTFRIFYSSVSSDMTGLSATTPTTATLSKIDISTSGVTPGTNCYYVLGGLASNKNYYMRIFTADEVPNWSPISNGATAQTMAGDSGVRYWISGGAGNWSNASNWSLSSGYSASGGVPLSSHTVVFDGGGGFNGDCNIDTTVTVATMTVSGYSGTINTQGFAVTVSSAFIKTSGTVSLSTSQVTFGGAFNNAGGTFNAGASTTTFTATSTQTIISGGAVFAHTVFNGNGGYWNLADQFSSTGSFSVTGGTINTTSSNYGIYVGSDVMINGGTLILNASTMTVGGNWARSAGTFTAGTSTVTFIGRLGGTSFSINSGGQSFSNMNINSANATWTLQNPLTALGNFSVSTGTFDTNSTSNYAVTVSSDFIFTKGTVNLNTSTLLVGGNWLNSSSGLSLNGLTSTATFTATSAKTLNSPNITWGNLQFNGSGGTWTLGTYLNVLSTLTFTAGTLDTSASNYNISSLNVLFNGGTLSANSARVTVLTNWTYSSGSFNTGLSTVTFGAWNNGVGSIRSSGAPFYNLEISQSNGQYSLASNITVNNQFTLSTGTFSTSSNNYSITVASSVVLASGTLNLNGSAMSVGRNWAVGVPSAVTFTAGTSTVTFASVSSSTLSGSTTFYGLRALTSGTTMAFTAGATQYVTNMVEFRNVGLLSTGASGTTWYFSYTGSSQTLSNLRVRDSNASPNGGFAMAADATSTNLGNNVNWHFFGNVTSCGSGNWNSSVVCAPWPSGVVPFGTDTVIVAAGHTVTSTGTVTVASVTVNASGILRLDGGTGVSAFTIANAGKLVNNGTVQVLNDANAVTLAGAVGGSMTYEGTDIDYNSKKIYLGRIVYSTHAYVSSGETIELMGNVTFNQLTTVSGASFIQGANNQLSVGGNLNLASGTFTKGTGTSVVKFSGTGSVNTANQNLGVVQTGP